MWERARIKVEPYWNVNVGKSYKNHTGGTIKVEPYWNVNVLTLDTACTIFY